MLSPRHCRLLVLGPIEGGKLVSCSVSILSYGQHPHQLCFPGPSVWGRPSLGLLEPETQDCDGAGGLLAVTRDGTTQAWCRCPGHADVQEGGGVDGFSPSCFLCA